ncbi:TonB protein C-terminal [Novosphingobium sp. CF614]|uniref:energy transducer TonB n=1 Tax=Novosphingobium sp. CF614 TaxID=1884364 RepID=UPI0008E9E550|nr:energy transducer TonB [Novosphingobium sp. CF614]SFG34565.1 TonB protein C-terminal [Novosphingobium sp. CF614]
MPVIWIAATTLAVPSTGMPFTRSVLQSYPTWAARQGKSAAATFDLLIDEAGKPIRCEVGQTFGDDKLAKEICPILMKQRCKPATLRDGKKVPGVVRSWISMSVDQTNPFAGLKLAPDFELQVNHLPHGADSAEVRLVTAVDQTGAIVDCGPDIGENDNLLVDVVCASRSLLKQYPRTDNQGNPIGYVSTTKVRLHIPEAKFAAAPQ